MVHRFELLSELSFEGLVMAEMVSLTNRNKRLVDGVLVLLLVPMHLLFNRLVV